VKEFLLTFDDALYLVFFLALPAGMAFLSRERRLFLLWVLIFAIPREFNPRIGPLSFCLTDGAFLGFVLPEALSFARRDGLKKGFLMRGTGFAWAALILFTVGSLFHLFTGGVPDPRFYLKDLLCFGGFPILLLAVRRSGVVWGDRFFYAMLGMLLALAVIVVLIGSVRPLSKIYVEALIRQHEISRHLGYFLPNDNPNGGFQKKVILYLAHLRVMDFIGGIPPGTTFLFLLPALLGIRYSKGWKSRLVLPALGFLFYSCLFADSRDLLGAIYLSLFSCLGLFRGEVGKKTVLCVGMFSIMVLLTPVGQKNLTRYNLLRKEGQTAARMETPAIRQEWTDKKAGRENVIPFGAIQNQPDETADSASGSEALGGNEPSPACIAGFRVYDTRIPIFKKALAVAWEHPLAGLGPGRAITFPYGDHFSNNTFVDSLYLTLAFKWGWGALLFFLAWLFHLARAWKRNWGWILQDPGLSGAVLRGFVPTAAGFLFFCFFLFPFMNLSFSMFLACYLGMTFNSLEAGRVGSRESLGMGHEKN
jgi:hypothetical protein